MNTWAIQHDPESYPDGDIFDPTRFLKNDLGSNDDINVAESDISRQKTYAFGAGRRICAGQRMAENSMLLSMAKIVWAFDIKPAGEEVLDTSVKTAWKDAILTGPKEVPLSFKVRGDGKRRVVAKEWQKADAFLKRYE